MLPLILVEVLPFHHGSPLTGSLPRPTMDVQIPVDIKRTSLTHKTDNLALPRRVAYPVAWIGSGRNLELSDDQV